MVNWNLKSRNGGRATMINKPLSREIVKQRYLFIKDSLEKKQINTYYSENGRQYHLIEMLVEIGDIKTASKLQKQLDPNTNRPISNLPEAKFEHAVREKALEKLGKNSNYKFSPLEAECVKKMPLTLHNKPTGKLLKKSIAAISL